MVIERVKTGIQGFDEIVQGGFPRGSTILVTGTPGTGKTIFALGYVYNGVKTFKERSLYVSFEQPEKMIKDQAAQFGWDLEPFIKKGVLEIQYIPIKELRPNTVDTIVKKVISQKIKRLVVDSLSTLAINAPIYTSIKDISLTDVMKGQSFFSPPILGDFIVKRFIYNFVDSLHIMNHTCTSVLISESPQSGEYLSRDTISEFICDGVVSMHYMPTGAEFPRNMTIEKMRHTNCEEGVFPVRITEKGIMVKKPEEVFK